MSIIFTQETLKFLKDLKNNNNRDWFTEHKKIYESEVKMPASIFADEMAAALTAEFGGAYRAKVFRIYRDVRFSKDKTPYNAHIRISFTPEPVTANRPAWYMGIETDTLVLGMGLFGFDKPGMERFRDRVAGKPGEVLDAELARLKAVGYRIGEPELTRIPRGYDKDHTRADLLRHKSITVWKDYDDASVAIGSNLTGDCMKTYRDMKPLYDWLLAV